MQNVLFFSLLSQNLNIGIYGAVVVRVLYGYETWSVTLREEHRLGLFENVLLRKISGPKRDEVTVEW
jgi:hypothetical protein